jgi:methylmalonyl-CoA mutase N-terminal domain/subunit
MDEALALPNESAARVALRTQQIIAHESGTTNTVDPLGGSYFVEQLTDQLEAEAWAYFERVEALGGVLSAIEAGFFQQEIADAAYRYQREVDSHARIIVGVNEFAGDEPLPIPILEMDPQGYEIQCARLEEVKANRDNRAVARCLSALRQAAAGTDNVMPYILDAVKVYATLQEMMDVFREVFGEYQEPLII